VSEAEAFHGGPIAAEEEGAGGGDEVLAKGHKKSVMLVSMPRSL